MSQMAQASDALCVLTPYFSPISNDRTLLQLNIKQTDCKRIQAIKETCAYALPVQRRRELLASPITGEENKHMQMQLSWICILALDYADGQCLRCRHLGRETAGRHQRPFCRRRCPVEMRQGGGNLYSHLPLCLINITQIRTLKRDTPATGTQRKDDVTEPTHDRLLKSFLTESNLFLLSIQGHRNYPLQPALHFSNC